MHTLTCTLLSAVTHVVIVCTQAEVAERKREWEVAHARALLALGSTGSATASISRPSSPRLSLRTSLQPMSPSTADAAAAPAKCTSPTAAANGTAAAAAVSTPSRAVSPRAAVTATDTATVAATVAASHSAALATSEAALAAVKAELAALRSSTAATANASISSPTAAATTVLSAPSTPTGSVLRRSRSRGHGLRVEVAFRDDIVTTAASNTTATASGTVAAAASSADIATASELAASCKQLEAEKAAHAVTRVSTERTYY
jgi:hypothetical protein